MAYALKFGSYTLPPTFSPTQEPASAVVPLSKLPGAREAGRAGGL